jgi:hypothetical protein
VRDPFREVRNDEYPLLASLLRARQFYSWTSQQVVRRAIVYSSRNLLYFAGLDAYNAFNVVESLVSLARDYNRTVVFTIHQPRSNIVALFDQLVVLAQGKLVYSGEYSQCQDYFDSIGRPCPPGFNIADYLSAFRLCLVMSHLSNNLLSRPHNASRA